MLDILLKAPINPISIIVYQQLQQQQHHQHHHCHHHHPAVISPVLFFVFPPLLFGVHPTAHGCFSKWTPMAHELFILKSSKFGWFRASLVCWNPYRNVILKSSVIMFSCCRTHGWQYCAVKAHRLVSMLTSAPPPCLADSEESEVTHDPKSSQSLPQEIGFTREKNKKNGLLGMVLIYDPWWLMDRTSYLVTRKYYLTCNGWSPYGIANLQIIFGYPLPGFSNMHLIFTILNSMPSLSFWGWKRRKSSCKPPRTRHGFTRDQVFLGFENQLPQDPEILWLIPSFRIESCLILRQIKNIQLKSTYLHELIPHL